MSLSAPSDALLVLAQVAWQEVDPADLRAHGGCPFVAIFARRWNYSIGMHWEGSRPYYYASVYRHDADTCRNSRSTTMMGAVGEAYVAALRRERLVRLN